MKRKHSIYFSVFLFFISVTAFAQYNDAGLWASLNIEKKLTPDLSLCFAEELRFNENITELGSFSSDIGIDYKLNKLIRVSANYRYKNKRRLDDSYDNRNRFYVDVTFREKFKPVIVSLRTRLQTQYTDIYTSSDGMVPRNYVREKLTLKFDLDTKISPWIYAEAYVRYVDFQSSFVDNMRYSAGLEYAINRMNSIEVFYLYQKEYNVKNPESDFITGIGYNLSF